METNYAENTTGVGNNITGVEHNITGVDPDMGNEPNFTTDGQNKQNELYDD